MGPAPGPLRPAWRAADRAPHVPSPRSREEGPPSQARGAHAPHTPPAQGMRRARKPPRSPGRVAPPPQGAQASRPEPRTPRAQGERRCGRRGPPPGPVCPLGGPPTSRSLGGLGQRRHASIRWLWRPLAPRRDMRYRSCVPRCMRAQVPTCVPFRSMCSCGSVRLARGGHALHNPPTQGMCRARKPPRSPGRAAHPPQGAQASRPEPRTPRA